MPIAELSLTESELSPKNGIAPQLFNGLLRTILLEQSVRRFGGAQVPARDKLPGVKDIHTAFEIASSCYESGKTTPYNEQVYAVLLGRLDQCQFMERLSSFGDISFGTDGIGVMLADLIGQAEVQAADTIFNELLKRRNQTSLDYYKRHRDSPLFSGFDKEWLVLQEVSKVSPGKAFEYSQLPDSIVNTRVQTAVHIEYARLEPESYWRSVGNTIKALSKKGSQEAEIARLKSIVMSVSMVLGSGVEEIVSIFGNFDLPSVNPQAIDQNKTYYHDHLSPWLIAYEKTDDKNVKSQLEKTIKARYEQALKISNTTDSIVFLDYLGQVRLDLACELELELLISSIGKPDLHILLDEQYSQLTVFMEDPNTYRDPDKLARLKALKVKAEQTNNPVIIEHFRLAELALEYLEMPIQETIQRLKPEIDGTEFRAIIAVLAPLLSENRETNGKLLEYIQAEKNANASFFYTGKLAKAISSLDSEGRLTYVEQNISDLLDAFATIVSGEKGHRLKLFLGDIFRSSTSGDVVKLFRLLIKHTGTSSGRTEEFDLMDVFDNNLADLVYQINDEDWWELIEEYPELAMSRGVGSERTLIAMLNLGLAVEDQKYEELLQDGYSQLHSGQLGQQGYMPKSYIAQLLSNFGLKDLKESISNRRVGFLRTFSELHSINEKLKEEDKLDDLPRFLADNARLLASIQMVAPNLGVAYDFIVGTVRSHGFERLEERLKLFETVKIQDIQYWRDIFTKNPKTTAEEMLRLVEFYNIFIQITRENSFWEMVETHDHSSSYSDLLRSLARTTLISMASKYGMPEDKVDIDGLENWDLEYFSRIYFGAAKMAETDKKLYRIVIKAGLMGHGELKKLVDPRIQEQIDPEVFSQEEISTIGELRRHNAIVIARLESYGISPDVFAGGVEKRYLGEISVSESIEMQAEATSSAVETLIEDIETRFSQEPVLSGLVAELKAQIGIFSQGNTSALCDFSEQLTRQPIEFEELKGRYIGIVRQGFGSRSDKTIIPILEQGIFDLYKGPAESLVKELFSIGNSAQKNPGSLEEVREKIRVLLEQLNFSLVGQEKYTDYSDSINALINSIGITKPIFNTPDVGLMKDTLSAIEKELVVLKGSGRYSQDDFEFVLDHLAIASIELSDYSTAAINTKPIKYDFTIRRWSGEPGVDLVQGNNALNCTAIDATNAFMVLQCLVALDIQPTVLYDNQRKRYVGLAYDFITEIQTDQGYRLAYNFDTFDLGKGVKGLSRVAREALFEYGSEVVRRINQSGVANGMPAPLKLLQIGRNYNDINVRDLPDEQQLMRVLTGPFLGLHRYLDMACMRSGGNQNGSIIEMLNYAYWLNTHARVIEVMPEATIFQRPDCVEEIIKIDQTYLQVGDGKTITDNPSVIDNLRVELQRIRLEEEGAGVCAPEVDEIIRQLASNQGELIAVTQQLAEPQGPRNNIVSYAITGVNGSTYEVSHLFISPYLEDEEKLTELMGRIVAEARNKGCNNVSVPIQADVEASVFIVRAIADLGKDIQPRITIPQKDLAGTRNLSLLIDHNEFITDDQTQRPIVELRFGI